MKTNTHTSLKPDVKTTRSLRKSAPILAKNLTLEQKEGLTDRLFAIHDQIFDGVSREDLRRYVIEPNSKLTKIWFFLNDAGQEVGYITFQVFETGSRRADPMVYRTEVGMLPAYRGNNAAMKVLFWQCALSYIQSLFQTSYFLATPIHPNPYCAASKGTKHFYPRPNQETPAPILEVMKTLSERLGIQGGITDRPFEKHVGWIVRNSPEQRRKLETSIDPLVQFYLKENPDYAQGKGLMILIPICFANGFYGVGKMGRKMIRRMIKKLSLRGKQLSTGKWNPLKLSNN